MKPNRSARLRVFAFILPFVFAATRVFGTNVGSDTAQPTGGNTASTISDLTARNLSVLDFGAKCDAVNSPTAGTITAGSTTFYTANQLASGAHIAITGASNLMPTGYVTNGNTLVFNLPWVTGIASGAAITDTEGVVSTTVSAVKNQTSYVTGNTHSTITVDTIASTAGLVPGMSVSDSAGDIPANTTLISFTPNASVTLSHAATGTHTGDMLIFSLPIPGQVTVNTTGTTANASMTISSVVSTANILIGMSITDSLGHIQPNTTVTGTTVNSITISQNAAGGASGDVLTISPGYEIVLTAGASGSPATEPDTLKIQGGTLATTVNSIGLPVNVSPTGTISNGSSVVTGVSSTAQISDGMAIGFQSGVIPHNTTVASFTSNTIVMSKAATGAGSSLTITGGQATLADQATTTVPTYVAVKVTSFNNAGSGYAAGDILTLSDGTTVVAQTLTSTGAISGATVLAQPVDISPPVNPVPTTTSGSGTGASLNMSYTPTGQYWYGSDDNSAINNALASAPTGSAVWLPNNKVCGTTQPIVLNGGQVQLRGWGNYSSGIVALGVMPAFEVGQFNSSVLIRANTVSPGGGARDLYIEGYKLATNTCGIYGGESETYRDMYCYDGLVSDWRFGDQSGVQIVNDVFNHIGGETDFNQFGPIAMSPPYNWTTDQTGNFALLMGSHFRGGHIPIEDAQTDYNAFLDNEVNQIAPFNAFYCAEMHGKDSIKGLECSNSIGSIVHLSGNDESVIDVFGQWQLSSPVAGSTCGVLIDNKIKYSFISDVRVDGNLSGPFVICQAGNADSSTFATNNPGASYTAPVDPITPPQGRLTFVSRTPVMTSNKLSQSTIYYTCYVGGSVPYFNGSIDAADVIPNCQNSLTLESANPGLESAADLFDVWWYDNGGSPVLCVATNGSGGGWTGDGGSLTARGTGYTDIDNVTRSYATNANALSNCYNGTTDYSVPANQGTYLGTFFTTAAGKTQFNPITTATAGGSQAVIGIWNAYNRVPVNVLEQDSHAAYTINANATWEVADKKNSGINNILAVDGLQLNPWNATVSQPLLNSGSNNPELSINISGGNSCAVATPSANNFAQQQAANIVTTQFSTSSFPLMGLSCAQAEEYATAGTATYFNPNLMLSLSGWTY